mmetsp:Transcript_15614/g.21583  ORF Transcript_15614/g.21583 Transcript_15614/m.21583 type:complete len:168 (+) Transcript_15614:189-692(+)|eukprot:CAMPEP_0196570848 /NCGR_PEP_ID=MMETSP1081-20130531/1031_1 /TAXON_ID=36882 /ORGANISM="Pyramimonas amylifera, Strain CCMP720" /LENGTH=167 /DNA_ID=CAMNT_0041887527 /DNA_START=175 /DNA_END=678 /DNA_ORIENTATION=+
MAIARWKLDFGDDKSKPSLPLPSGYNATLLELEDSGSRKRTEVDSSLKQKKVWELAKSPVKNIGMMTFMMWMSGNTVQLFSIMITFTGLAQPLKAIMSSGQMFERFADKNTEVLLPRMLFCAMQLFGFAVALYKLSMLGLLPTHTSDWITAKVPQVVEFASGGTPLY